MKKRVLAALMVLALCLGLAPNAASADVLTEDLPEIGAASYAIIDGRFCLGTIMTNLTIQARWCR